MRKTEAEALDVCCGVCGKWFTPLKVWTDGPLVHSAGIRTCSFECSRQLYNLPIMPPKWAYKIPVIKAGDDG